MSWRVGRIVLATFLATTRGWTIRAAFSRGNVCGVVRRVAARHLTSVCRSAYSLNSSAARRCQNRHHAPRLSCFSGPARMGTGGPDTPRMMRKCTIPRASPATARHPRGLIAQQRSGMSLSQRATSRPSSTAHSRTVWSSEALRIHRPSGLNVQLCTAAVCPPARAGVRRQLSSTARSPRRACLLAA
jgi:hypothetical protein